MTEPGSGYAVELPLRLAFLLADSDPEGALAYLDEAARLGAPAADLNPLRIRLWLRPERRREGLRRLEPILRRPESVPGFLKAAEIRALAGAFASAESLLRRAALRFPSEAAPRAVLARLLLWRADAAGARRLAEEALRLSPEDPAARAARGGALSLLGRLAAAERDLDAAVAAGPTIETLVWRGETRRRLGRWEEALADADAALAIQGGLPPATVLRARAILDGGAVGRDWRLEYFAALESAAHFGLWRLDYRVRPTRAAARRSLRAIFDALGGNYSATVTRLGRGGRTPVLCRRPPPSLRARAIAAQALLPLRGEAAALARLGELQRRSPDEAAPYLYRGELLLWIGRAADGRRDFETALRVRPTGDYANFGIALAEMLTGDPRRAIELCEKVHRPALHSFAAQANYRSYRGEARLRAGLTDEACGDLAAAAGLNPHKLSTWVLLALAAEERGRSSRGDAVFAALERWSPDLLGAAARAAGGDRGRRAVLRAAVGLMRGNRSTWLPFYTEPDGRRRFLDRMPFDEMRSLGRSVAAEAGSFCKRSG